MGVREGQLGVLLFLSCLFILPPSSLPEITRAPLVYFSHLLMMLRSF
jgi:hypothetical protein